MGIKSMSSNKKKALKSRKSDRWHRTLKAEKKKTLPVETVEIANIHLFSKQKLQNKLRNPKNNIKISGKKARRLTKRLGHSLREKSQMDIEVISTRGKPGRGSGAKDADIVGAKDADMVEANAESSTTAAAIPPSTSSSLPATTATKKKKRGGKKHKKGASGKPNDEGQVFENNDGWEDVEMTDA